jgi:protein subunit release factor A
MSMEEVEESLEHNPRVDRLNEKIRSLRDDWFNLHRLVDKVECVINRKKSSGQRVQKSIEKELARTAKFLEKVKVPSPASADIARLETFFEPDPDKKMEDRLRKEIAEKQKRIRPLKKELSNHIKRMKALRKKLGETEA